MTSVEENTFEWTAKDGAVMFARHWKPRGDCDASIFLIHGFGEHTGRYARLAAFFGANRAEVFAFDLRWIEKQSNT